MAFQPPPASQKDSTWSRAAVMAAPFPSSHRKSVTALAWLRSSEARRLALRSHARAVLSSEQLATPSPLLALP